LIGVTALLRTVVKTIKEKVRCILDRRCIGGLSFDTFSDITQRLMCFGDRSGASVIEEASTTKVRLSACRPLSVGGPAYKNAIIAAVA
jgi:hypothetical protein